MASAFATATNSFATTASNYANSASASTSDNNKNPKFDEYRSRVMLGELPDDFLRIQLTRPQLYYDSQADAFPQVHQAQQSLPNPNFLGHLTLTVAEGKLIRNFGPLGLLKMDPYVRIRLGHIAHETPRAQSGGKNPQWKVSYRINLFKGMDTIYLEVFDERNFTEDEFIGECHISIPQEVFNGETKQNWYPLTGKQNQNEGDILLIMSFVPFKVGQPNLDYQMPLPAPNINNNIGTTVTSSGNEMPSNASTSLSQSPTRSTSTIPKPQQSDNIHQQQNPQRQEQHSQNYSQKDVTEVQEVFPEVARSVIEELFDINEGNRELVVDHLLQITAK